MLSWFGGVRVKKKTLRFEEQRWLLRFHTHQDKYKDMMYKSSFVKLPEAVSTEVDKGKEEGQTPMVEGEKVPGMIKTDPNLKTVQPGQIPPGLNPQIQQGGLQKPPNLPQNQQFRQPMPLQQAPVMPHPGMRPQQRMPTMGGDNQRRTTLNEIRTNALHFGSSQQQQQPYRTGMYPGQRPVNLAPMGGAPYNQAQASRMHLVLRQHHQRRVMAMRNQQMAAMQQQGQYYHPGLQPMQANPPVPMHQVMRQGYSRPQMMPQQGGVMQPGMQYQQRPNQPMGGIHRPGMY